MSPNKEHAIKKLLERFKKGDKLEKTLEDHQRFKDLFDQVELVERLFPGYSETIKRNLIDVHGYSYEQFEQEANKHRGYQKFVMPIVRRVHPGLIANEIGKIQPMTAPVGGIFYMDYKYGDKEK